MSGNARNASARRGAHTAWPGLLSAALLTLLMSVDAARFVFHAMDDRPALSFVLLVLAALPAFFALLPASLPSRTRLASASSVAGASLVAPCLVVVGVTALRAPCLVDPFGSAVPESGYFVRSELPLPALLAWIAGLPWRALRRRRHG